MKFPVALVLAVSSLLLPAFARAAEVKFTLETAAARAAKGLGAAWNDKNHPLLVHVGDDLVFTNGDTVKHLIHTDGTPFPHPDTRKPVLPGKTVTYKIEKAHDSFRDGALYDHIEGKSSGQLFWVVAE